ncbi:hypothetical protein KC323_g277 [Hortaea werneckii]|nr:hypothetical protein KC323_g277 [Hortaea werneckii]
MWDVERGSVVFLFKSVASSALVNAGLPEHEISKERPESHRQHDPAVIYRSGWGRRKGGTEYLGFEEQVGFGEEDDAYMMKNE